MESEIKKKFDEQGVMSIAYLMRKYKMDKKKAEQMIEKIYKNNLIRSDN